MQHWGSVPNFSMHYTTVFKTHWQLLRQVFFHSCEQKKAVWTRECNMTLIFRHWAATGVFASACLSALLPAQAAPARQDNLPPSAKLAYTVSASHKGLKIGGHTDVVWQADAQGYQAVLTTRALLVGTILEERSSGSVTKQGLRPQEFTEKRLRKQPTGIRFDHAGKTAIFSPSQKEATFKGRVQDKASALWQLIAMARSNPNRFQQGTTWKMPVAGRDEMQTWTFEVMGKDTLDTPLGKLKTVQIKKLPRNEDKTDEILMWLAPAKEWYPVKLRYTEENGDYIEQMIKSIDKQ